MEGVAVQPHIQIGAKDIRPVVLVVGDPARAALVASMCDEAKELAYNREYRTFDCKFNDEYITVASHGVGSAGAAICFEELIKAGAKVIIRAGTAGSLQPRTIGQGDVVICHAAVREDGVSQLIVPQGYPAVADPMVYNALAEAANVTDRETKFGTTLTSDLFYKSSIMPSTLDMYAKAGVEIVEMEVATLLIIARVKGIKAGAVCTIDGSPFEWSSENYDPTGTRVKTGKEVMLKIALHALAKISKEKLYV